MSDVSSFIRQCKLVIYTNCLNACFSKKKCKKQNKYLNSVNMLFITLLCVFGLFFKAIMLNYMSW